MPILTLPEAKIHVGETGTTRDTEIQRYINAATDLIEDYAGPVQQRQLTHAAAGYGVEILERRIASIDSVLVSGTSVVGFTVNLEAGLLYGAPRGAVITYTVGFAVIPESVRQAAFDTVQHAYESHSGAVPTTYGATDETFVVSRGFALPNSAKEWLSPYRRPAGVL